MYIEFEVNPQLQAALTRTIEHKYIPLRCIVLFAQ